MAFVLFSLAIIVKYYEEFVAMRAAYARIPYNRKIFKYFLIFFAFLLFMTCALFENSILHIECDSVVKTANVTGNVTSYAYMNNCIQSTVPGNPGVMYLLGAMAILSIVLLIIWVLQAFGEGV